MRVFACMYLSTPWGPEEGVQSLELDFQKEVVRVEVYREYMEREGTSSSLSLVYHKVGHFFYYTTMMSQKTLLLSRRAKRPWTEIQRDPPPLRSLPQVFCHRKRRLPSTVNHVSARVIVKVNSVENRCFSC